jgi:hypothetical protein
VSEPDRTGQRAPWAPPDCHCPHVEQWFRAIAEKLEIDMAAIDDLTTAVSGLSTEITTFLADVAAQISGGVTEAEAEQVVAQINGFTAQLQAADPATPAPAPAPTPSPEPSPAPSGS